MTLKKEENTYDSEQPDWTFQGRTMDYKQEEQNIYDARRAH
jgi:hypothetical protein